jgi:hypothetical protein
MKKQRERYREKRERQGLSYNPWPEERRISVKRKREFRTRQLKEAPLSQVTALKEEWRKQDQKERRSRYVKRALK